MATVENHKPTAMEAAIDVVATFGGVAFGFCGGYYLNKLLPIAVTTTEEVVRGVAVGLGGTIAGTIGKRALQEEMTEMHTMVVLSQLEAKGLLDANEVEEIKEVVENKTKANQATARKK